MVFSVFGITSLLPEGEDSFYYKYLVSQVTQKIGKEIKTYIWRYSRLVYAAKEQVRVEDLTWEEVTEKIIKSQVPDVQYSISQKLSKIDFDLSTPAIDPSENFSTNTTPQQILKNITVPKIFEPPKILSIDTQTRKFTIPDGFYSNEERLKNGGFFIEEGFDVAHKHAGDWSVFLQSEYDELASLPGNDIGNGPTLLEQVVHDSTIGRYLFGSINNQAAFQTTLDERTEDEILQLSTVSGKLSRQEALTHLFVLDNLDKLLDTLVPGIGSDKEAVATLVEEIKNKITTTGPLDIIIPGMGSPNKFFTKFGYYKTLNLLIPVLIDGSEIDINNVMIAKYINFQNEVSNKNEGFFNAILDKKYFLMEESGQNIYFKLPLLVFYDDKSAEESQLYNSTFTPYYDLKSKLKSITENNPELNSAFIKIVEAADKILDALETKDQQMKNLFYYGSNQMSDQFQYKFIDGWNEHKGIEIILNQPNNTSPKGIWSLINSKPDQLQDNWGKSPLKNPYLINFINENANHIFNLSKLINLSSGKGFHREGEITVTGPDGENYQQSKVTGKAVPPNLIIYWNGGRWLVANSQHMAEKLELVWNAVEQFNSSNNTVYKPYTRGNIENSFKIAEDKFALLGIATASNSDVSDGLLNIELLAKEWDGNSVENTWNSDTPLTKIKLFENRAQGNFTDGRQNKSGWVAEVISRYILSADMAAGLMGIVKYSQKNKPYPYNPNEAPTAKWLSDPYNAGSPNYYGLDSFAVTYSAEAAELQLEYELAFGNAVLLSISQDPRFVTMAESIQYKSLLSFISIMLAELMERKYPKVETMFEQTYSTIITALNSILNVANRNNDPNFYQKTDFKPNLGQNNTSNGTTSLWAPLVLEALLKTYANVTDPTWKTPWFLPGPLTPVGVVTKLLDSMPDLEPDGDITSQSLAASQKNTIGATPDTKCPPEEGNS